MKQKEKFPKHRIVQKRKDCFIVEYEVIKHKMNHFKFFFGFKDFLIIKKEFIPYFRLEFNNFDDALKFIKEKKLTFDNYPIITEINL